MYLHLLPIGALIIHCILVLLNAENVVFNPINQLLQQHKYVLVFFYIPNCLLCDKIRPQFNQAMEQLLQLPENEIPNIHIVALDGTQSGVLTEHIPLHHYPIIKLLYTSEDSSHSLKVLDYPLNINYDIAEDLIAWTVRSLRPPIRRVRSMMDVHQLIQSADVVALGLFQSKSSALSLFQSISSSFPHMHFGYCLDVQPIFQYFNFTPTDTADLAEVIIVKELEDFVEYFRESFQFTALTHFLQLHGQPLLKAARPNVDIFAITAEYKFIVFQSQSSPAFHSNKQILLQLASRWLGKLEVVLVNVDVTDNAALMQNVFGMDPVSHHSSSVGAHYRIVRLLRNGHILKYRPSDESMDNIDTMEEFIQQVLLHNELSPYHLSQEPPANWNASFVKILVGHNFYSFLLSESRLLPALVLFYSSACNHCKHVLVTWEKLAEHLEQQGNQDVVILGKLDVLTNELPDTTVNNVPLIKLFPPLSLEGIEYNGQRTLHGLVNFIQSNGKKGALAKSDEDDRDDDDDDNDYDDPHHEEL